MTLIEMFETEMGEELFKKAEYEPINELEEFLYKERQKADKIVEEIDTEVEYITHFIKEKILKNTMDNKYTIEGLKRAKAIIDKHRKEGVN